MLPSQTRLLFEQLTAYKELSTFLNQQFSNTKHQRELVQRYYPNSESKEADVRNIKRKNRIHRVSSQHYEVPQKYLPMSREFVVPESNSGKQEYVSITHKQMQVVEKPYTSLQPTTHQLYKNDPNISSSTLDFLFPENMQNDTIQQQTKLPETTETIEENTLLEIKQEPLEIHENLIPEPTTYHPEPDTDVQEILDMAQDATVKFETNVSPYNPLIIDLD